MKDSIHIADLIVQQRKATITPAGQKELDKWIAASPENREVFMRATDPARQLEKLEVYRMFRTEKAWVSLEEELFGSKTRRFIPRKIMRYAAAILLPLAIGTTVLLMMRSPGNEKTADIDKIYRPGSEKAVLILSDGRTLNLSPESQFTPLKEQGSTIEYGDNQLRYTTSEEGASIAVEMAYNQLRTPRGGSYTLQLSDGTRIWVNAASSLKFPVTFIGDSREVYLEGEAYFEVTRSSKPFIVHTLNSSTQVLGTSFNIRAFEDDAEEMTTLLEGSVRVTATNDDANKLVLQPNQQAILNKTTAGLERKEVDATSYVSWISGKLEFHDEPLDKVMKDLARWYNFEYTFENESAKDFHFSARLNRNTPISEILEMLEMTTDVEFVFKEKVISIR